MDDINGPNDATGCVELKNLHRAELLQKTPAAVYLILERRNLMPTYRDLTEHLYAAKRGSMGAWKCSQLYRSIYIRGYERAFKANNVSIYLTKEEKKSTLGKAAGSIIQVCFVDRIKDPTYMPPNIYTDGKVLNFHKGSGCHAHPDGCAELGKLPKGVYGQIYDNFPFVFADKSVLPVDVLKLLEKKNAMSENIEMSAMINTGDKSGFAAAEIIRDFKEQFQAKGINIFYAQTNFSYYKCNKALELIKQCKWIHEWHQWFEYADIDVVGNSYTPTIGGLEVEYPQKLLTLHDECQSGNTRSIARYLAYYSGQKKWEGCGNVAGATERHKKEYPNCKCKADNHRVFCGAAPVANRRFDIDSVLTLEGCSERRAYCSSKSCRPPTVPEDRP